MSFLIPAMFIRMMILCGLLPLLLSGIRAIKDVEVCSNQPADIGFLIDESGSVSQTNFNINLDLVKKFVDDFEIGNNAVKISVFAFHQLIGDGFYFSCCHSKASIKSEIDNINFASGGEDFEMALTFAKSYMFQSVNGARSCTLKILMFFTDGVGSGVNKDTLNKIATNGSYVFMMPSYSDLLGEGYSNITSQICIDVLTNSCERISKPCKNTETCVWTGGSRYMVLGINGSTDNNCTKGLVYYQQNK
ncbi:Hypothetical predicted protein [Mytilus galloprovincialis]|uniref:VWFA domain-containing protein n=1 Tax=Mytilus galloprovincialis TaxID=29158 RepID=A0A8B6F5S2_MYTGA|nr:Hypothetical predicted protein [Mytilus galloprovincialis]